MNFLLLVFLSCLAPSVYLPAEPAVTEPIEKIGLSADDPLLVRTIVAETGQADFQANLERVPTSVALTDLKTGREHFTDKVRKRNGYSYHFGLDKLADGRYCLSVTKAKITKKQVLLIRDGVVVCSDWK